MKTLDCPSLPKVCSAMFWWSGAKKIFNPRIKGGTTVKNLVSSLRSPLWSIDRINLAKIRLWLAPTLPQTSFAHLWRQHDPYFVVMHNKHECTYYIFFAVLLLLRIVCALIDCNFCFSPTHISLRERHGSDFMQIMHGF